jgi:hypothetical protein
MNGLRIGRLGTSVVALALAAGVCASIDGCTQTRQAEHAVGIGGGVPKKAQKLASGTGSQGINIASPSSGTVYVEDESTAEVVYSGKVSQGDQITVDGSTNTVTAGQFKKDVKLNRNDTYSVYVDPK